MKNGEIDHAWRIIYGVLCDMNDRQITDVIDRILDYVDESRPGILHTGTHERPVC